MGIVVCFPLESDQLPSILGRSGSEENAFGSNPFTSYFYDGAFDPTFMWHGRL